MDQGALCVLLFGIGLTAGLLIAVAAYATELKRMARFLRQRDPQSNARLTVNTATPSLTQLAASINSELDRNTQASIDIQRHQQEFQRDLSALSHDIRTPLMGAKGYLQLAAEEPNPAVRAQRLSAAADRIDATANLLEQLFSYTKASDPDLALTCEHLELEPLVERILLGHYPEFEARGWEPELVATDPSATILANADALTRIVENLVVNALRYGTSAPRIELAGGRLSVSNRVANPAALDIDHLFDRFYQADTARNKGGAGLGLATSAKLAHAMNLQLSAELKSDLLSIILHAPRR